MDKVCVKCGVEKPEIEFYRHKKCLGGYRGECKSCSRQYEQARYKKLKNEGHKYIKNKQESTRTWNLKNSFGITDAQYELLLEKQDYKCAICDIHQDKLNRRLAVDHCHETGEIRGLLCDLCNRYLIRNFTSPDIFIKAANYLSGSFTGLHVPTERKR